MMKGSREEEVMMKRMREIGRSARRGRTEGIREVMEREGALPLMV